MKKNIVWEKVCFEERKPAVCDLTFRPSGQIVFGAATLEALSYPKYINLYVSPGSHLIALKAGEREDPDVIQLTATVLPKDEPRTISGKKVYRWLCGLIGKEDVLIKLSGTPSEDGMVVFDVEAAGVVPKRIRKAATGVNADS